jgi:hypothetical protein
LEANHGESESSCEKSASKKGSRKKGCALEADRKGISQAHTQEICSEVRESRS